MIYYQISADPKLLFSKSIFLSPVDEKLNVMYFFPYIHGHAFHDIQHRSGADAKDKDIISAAWHTDHNECRSFMHRFLFQKRDDRILF
jgi:hypothetical protein